MGSTPTFVTDVSATCANAKLYMKDILPPGAASPNGPGRSSPRGATKALRRSRRAGLPVEQVRRVVSLASGLYTLVMDILRDDLLWLAGLLEGEGSFVKGPPSRPNAIGIAVEMIDEDVVERLANLFRVALVRLPSRNHKWKPTFRVLLRGDRAAALT